jgi:hypothetical protein
MGMLSGRFGPYFDGRRLRWADALKAWRELERLLGSPEQVAKQIQDAAPDIALQAEQQLIAASRVALELEPLDPDTGLGVSDLSAKQLATELIIRSRGE